MRSDNKRPDDLSLIYCWDDTVSCPFADSYVQTTIGSAGAVAELAATCKASENSELLLLLVCVSLTISGQPRNSIFIHRV